MVRPAFLRLLLSSPSQLRRESYGEVTNPERFDQKLRPTPGGLSCPQIFGSAEDFQCGCGGCQGEEYQGFICAECRGEIRSLAENKKRFGHIELAAPVLHPWFVDAAAELLDLPHSDLQSVLEGRSFLVTQAGPTQRLREGEVLSEEHFEKAFELFGDAFEALTGASAIQKQLEKIEVEVLLKEIKTSIQHATNKTRTENLNKRLAVIEALHLSEQHPTQLMLEVLPVMPLLYRSMVQEEDEAPTLDSLYQSVLLRNLRCQRLLGMDVPEIILRNEKARLQETVKELFLGIRRGLFRQNPLEKSVDFSGRAFVVPEPSLSLFECGVPRELALLLWKPFFYRKLREEGWVTDFLDAEDFIKEDPEAWEVLGELLSDAPIFLQKSPALQRREIQGFRPVLCEGRALRVHPLVAAAMGLALSGEEISIHLPLSKEAKREALSKASVFQNLPSLTSSAPNFVPGGEALLGLYLLTSVQEDAKGTGRAFSSLEEAEAAFEEQQIELQASIKIKWRGEKLETTLGRARFLALSPEALPLQALNQTQTRESLSYLFSLCQKEAGEEKTLQWSEALFQLGVSFVTRSGFSLCIEDLSSIDEKASFLSQGGQRFLSVEEQYMEGLITDGERHNKHVSDWDDIGRQIQRKIKEALWEARGPLWMMQASGAGLQEAHQQKLCALYGAVRDLSGDWTEQPITQSLREGLDTISYFYAARTSQRALCDEMLRESQREELLRWALDAAHSLKVVTKDCQSTDALEIGSLLSANQVLLSLEERSLRRTAAQEVLHPLNENIILCKEGQAIDEESARQIERAGVSKIKVRSPLLCSAEGGICAACYGLSSEVGFSAGVVAAQALRSPEKKEQNDQRGEVTSMEVTQRDGVIRFENAKLVTRKDGAQIVINRNAAWLLYDEKGVAQERHPLVYGARLLVGDGQRVQAKQTISEWEPWSIPLLSSVGGFVRFQDLYEYVTMIENIDLMTGLSRQVVSFFDSRYNNPRIEIVQEPGYRAPALAVYRLPQGAVLNVTDGDEIGPGTVLAKIPRPLKSEATKGYHRLLQLFEAEPPEKSAVIAQVDGVVSLMKRTGDSWSVTIKAEYGGSVEQLVPLGRILFLHEGDPVQAGDKLCDGADNPHDLLTVFGERTAARYLLDEIQKELSLMGLRVLDVHIEVLLRQMFSWIRIKQTGDSYWREGELVHKEDFLLINQDLYDRGLTPAIAEAVLLGLTQVAEQERGFLWKMSTASATKPLAEAALRGVTEDLTRGRARLITGRAK